METDPYWVLTGFSHLWERGFHSFPHVIPGDIPGYVNPSELVPGYVHPSELVPCTMVGISPGTMVGISPGTMVGMSACTPWWVCQSIHQGGYASLYTRVGVPCPGYHGGCSMPGTMVGIVPGCTWWVYIPGYTGRVYTPGYTTVLPPVSCPAIHHSHRGPVCANRALGSVREECPGWEPFSWLKLLIW